MKIYRSTGWVKYVFKKNQFWAYSLRMNLIANAVLTINYLRNIEYSADNFPFPLVRKKNRCHLKKHGQIRENLACEQEKFTIGGDQAICTSEVGNEIRITLSNLLTS